jgi:hypothetical protein
MLKYVVDHDEEDNVKRHAQRQGRQMFAKQDLARAGEVHAGGSGPGRDPARTQGERARAAEKRTMRTRRVDRTTRTRMLVGYTQDGENARAHGPAKEQEGSHGVGKAGHSTRSSVRTKTERERDETLMFSAGRLDTIYLLWESPSGMSRVRSQEISQQQLGSGVSASCVDSRSVLAVRSGAIV